jgi:hypothetical protein
MSRSKKATPAAYAPKFWQCNIRSSAHEFIRHTQQYSGTVTSVFLCADSTSMIEIHQHLNGVLNNLTLRYFIERSDHTHTAGVMLRIRVVHPVWSVDREI